MTSYNLIAFTFLGKYVITLLDIVFLFAKANLWDLHYLHLIICVLFYIIQ